MASLTISAPDDMIQQASVEPEMTSQLTNAASPLNQPVRPRPPRPRPWWRLACVSIAAGFLLTGIAVLFACATLGRPPARAFFEWAGFAVLQTPDSDTFIASNQELGFSVFISPTLVALTWREELGPAGAQEKTLEFAGFRYRRSAVIAGSPPTIPSSIGASKWSLFALCMASAVLSCMPLILRRRSSTPNTEAHTNA